MTPTPQWDGRFWSCVVRMPAFRPMLETSSDDEVGVILLTTEAYDLTPSPQSRPLQEQFDAVTRLEAEQDALFATVLSGLRAHYGRVRGRYLRFALRQPDVLPDPATSHPENPDDATFAALHELEGVNVLPAVLNGRAYLGLCFRAAWSDEHGVGVIVHDQRVIRVSDRDSAMTWGDARRDAEARGGRTSG